MIVPLWPPAQAAVVAAEKHAVTCPTCARGRACNQLLELANLAARLNGTALPTLLNPTEEEL